MGDPNANNRDKSPPGCRVSSTRNFAIGAVALAVAVVAGYLIFQWAR